MINNKQFIQGFLNGDSDVLNKIYNQSYSSVEKYILNHNGTKSDTQDVFHNALLILFVKLKEEKIIIKSFENYFFIVCVNLWKKEIKKKRVTSIDVIPLVNEELDLAAFYLEQSQWELYKEKFELLSINCKTILQLIFDNQSYEVIIKKLGYRTALVARQRVFKCKSKLIKLIKNDARYSRLKK